MEDAFLASPFQTPASRPHRIGRWQPDKKDESGNGDAYIEHEGGPELKGESRGQKHQADEGELHFDFVKI